MAHVGPRARRVADLKGLLHGLEHESALSPHVAGVQAAVAGQRGGHGGHLGGRRVHVGDVDQAGGEAERASGERLSQKILHLADLGRRRGALLEAHDLGAQVAEPYECGHVARRSHGVDGGEVVVDAVPASVEIGRADANQRSQSLEASLGPDGDAAVADHDGGHPLTQRTVHPRVREGRKVRVRMHVDEAWGESAAAGFDDARSVDPRAGTGSRHVVAGLCGVVADDGRDAPVGDSDGRREGRAATAVDDQRVCDQQVEHELTLPEGRAAPHGGRERGPRGGPVAREARASSVTRVRGGAGSAGRTPRRRNNSGDR